MMFMPSYSKNDMVGGAGDCPVATTEPDVILS